jgi:dephospho-CoA kinase
VLRVGLTGGIASGKSVVLRRLSEAGLLTLDLDHVAHELMAQGGAAYGEVVAAFGPRILRPDATIDRQRLGRIVFADDAARERLNAIVHPLVRAQEALREAALADEPGAVMVTDGALLVETGAHLRFDRLVVAHCPPWLQLERLLARDGLAPDDARARIAAQMPNEERLRYAHLRVNTEGAIEETRRGADLVVDELRRIASEPRRTLKVRRAQARGALAYGPTEGPRGLTPLSLLQEAAAGLDLPRLLRRLRPPAPGPWYADPAFNAGPEPATVAVPVVLWALSRNADPEFVIAAMHSVARLTHRDPRAISRACLFALTLVQVAEAGTLLPDLELRMARNAGLAARWGGDDAAPSLAPVVRAALRHPHDPQAAQAGAPEMGAEPGLAGALVGLAVGSGVSSAAAYEDALAAIERDGNGE